MTTITLPPVTPAFRDAVHALGCQIGWRNVAKMIAYGPTVATVATPNSNGHKRNGTRKAYTLAYYDAKGLHFSTYERCKVKGEWRTGWELACEQAHELERTRFERPIPYPFTPARRMEVQALDQSDIRLALYRPKKCCGSSMGIMESWVQGEAEAIYQCAINPKHTEPAVRVKRAAKPRREA